MSQKIICCSLECEITRQCSCSRCLCCSNCSLTCKCPWVVTDPNDKLAKLLGLNSEDYRLIFLSNFLPKIIFLFLRIVREITSKYTAMDEKIEEKEEGKYSQDDSTDEDETDEEDVWEFPEEVDEDWEAEMFGLPCFDDNFLASELD